MYRINCKYCRGRCPQRPADKKQYKNKLKYCKGEVYSPFLSITRILHLFYKTNKYIDTHKHIT